MRRDCRWGPEIVGATSAKESLQQTVFGLIPRPEGGPAKSPAPAPSIPNFHKHTAATLFEDTGVAQYQEQCMADLIVKAGQPRCVGGVKLSAGDLAKDGPETYERLFHSRCRDHVDSPVARGLSDARWSL